VVTLAVETLAGAARLLAATRGPAAASLLFNLFELPQHHGGHDAHRLQPGESTPSGTSQPPAGLWLAGVGRSIEAIAFEAVVLRQG
ncbi:hypothetical protein HaLaN_28611, partial [Haematococcus lacustris]